MKIDLKRPHGRKISMYHMMALVAVVIWGTTFVSTKILLHEGLSPAEIMFYRFSIAYLVMFAFSPRVQWPKSLKDELLFVLAGVSGGSLYFLAENMALDVTLASNVALIIGAAPILTLLLSRIWLKNERITRNVVIGSCVALCGVAFVVYNGNFILKIHPLGDILALVASLTWAAYNIVLKKLDHKYSTLYTTRKVFFYGVLTLLPVFIFTPLNFDAKLLVKPIVLYNLLFLGLAASLLCYFIWNMAVKNLGTVVTSNYIYIVPLVALIASVFLLNETVTIVAISGAALIIGGVYVAEKGFKIVGISKVFSKN